MFIAALFTIARTWKQPKCPSTDEWINKMYCTHIMEYYSAMKRNVLMHDIISMNLENNMLN